MIHRLSKRNLAKGIVSMAFLSAIGLPRIPLCFALENKDNAMKISSPAFETGALMPEIYAQEPVGISPPLKITDVPKDAVSLVLLATDPDVPNPENPTRTVIHWVVANLPPDTKELPAGAKLADIPGVIEGLNERKETGYIGPRPPTGTHRYYFRLYALDTKLSFSKPPTIEEVKEAMKGHIIAEAETYGRYILKKNR